MIEARAVFFQAGENVLLKNVSFSLACGEVLAVLGPNGAGKSTLLRCLSGELKPSSGGIFVHGTPLDVAHHSAAARWRGILPQATRGPFAFSVREIVCLGRSPHVLGAERPKDYEIVEDAMRSTDILHLADRSVQTLSGGELQRVHMARVLAQIWEPTEQGRLLLLDEPTSALDFKHQQALLSLARDWSRRETAVFLILHEINHAIRFADRILWMKNGSAVALGSPEETVRESLLREIFEVDAHIHRLPDGGRFVEIRGGLKDC